MKTLNYLIVAALVIFTATSCVENSEKYKTLLSEKESLQSSLNTTEKEFNETLEILNAVQAGFRQIAEEEGKIAVNLENGNSQTKKQEINSQFNQIREIIAENKESIKKLNAKIASTNRSNRTLTKTVKALEAQLKEKVALIEQLQAELAKKDIMIQELNASVNQLNSSVASLEQTKASQANTISTLDENLNTVWICITSSRELKAANIRQGSKVLRTEFNKDLFTKGDLRDIKSIPTDSRRVKFYTNHPVGSYTLEKGEDKNITIVITNPDLFWSVSKYLVAKN